MDLSKRAVRVVNGATELSPILRRWEPTRQLLAAAGAWGTYPRGRKQPTLKAKAIKWEREFMIDAIASTMDRRKNLWTRNAGWALFFLARALDLLAQNFDVQAEKQLGYAEEELQLGASAKAMVSARTRAAQLSRAKAKRRTPRRR